MAEMIAELRALSDEELIKKHDQHAPSVQVATKHYLEELHRRDQGRVSEAILKLTRRITVMTAVITLATIINVTLLALGSDEVMKMFGVG